MATADTDGNCTIPLVVAAITWYEHEPIALGQWCDWSAIATSTWYHWANTPTWDWWVIVG